jgi:hypothetical protein
MKTSHEWFDYFQTNLKHERIDWEQVPNISEAELQTILPSLQAWQLGETSDGSNLLRATEKYAFVNNDPFYLKAMQLFIKEEQKHGNNLGRYLRYVQQPLIKSNWGDSLFRKIRHLNTSMEMWTLSVITVESTAQLFYQSLKDATRCRLLKQICTDILIDEATHISFQMERMAIIFKNKSLSGQWLSFYCYKAFFFCTAAVVWMAHKKVFVAGGHTFGSFFKAMSFKFRKNIAKLKVSLYEKQVPQAVGKSIVIGH